MMRVRKIEVQPSDDEPTLLVGLVCFGVLRSQVEDHLDELERLVDTAGGRVVGRIVQDRFVVDMRTVSNRDQDDLIHAVAMLAKA